MSEEYIPVTRLTDIWYPMNIETRLAYFTANDEPLGMPHKRLAQFAVWALNMREQQNLYTLRSFVPPTEHLDVPYLPQWGPTADERPGDCGPACVAMIAHELTDCRPTVDEAAHKCGQPATAPGWGYTNHGQLRTGASEFGFTLETRSPYTKRYGKEQLSLSLLKAQAENDLPSIALIHYGVLRDETNAITGVVKNQDQNYGRGHWVVFLGAEGDDTVYIHDPDFWGVRQQDGNSRKVPATAFEKALGAIAPGCSVGYQGLIVKS